MERNLDLINSKIRKYKLLRFLNIFLASLLSLIGTISIVSLLMFLNMVLDVGYFVCFVLTFILPQLYSFVIDKLLLRKIENIINDNLSDFVKLTEENKCNLDLELEIRDNDLELRFERLSSRSKLELLAYIKNGITIDDRDNRSLSTSLESNYNKEDNDIISIESGYVRSRNIETERGKKHH